MYLLDYMLKPFEDWIILQEVFLRPELILWKYDNRYIYNTISYDAVLTYFMSMVYDQEPRFRGSKLNRDWLKSRSQDIL